MIIKRSLRIFQQFLNIMSGEDNTSTTFTTKFLVKSNSAVMSKILNLSMVPISTSIDHPQLLKFEPESTWAFLRLYNKYFTEVKELALQLSYL